MTDDTTTDKELRNYKRPMLDAIIRANASPEAVQAAQAEIDRRAANQRAKKRATRAAQAPPAAPPEPEEPAANGEPPEPPEPLILQHRDQPEGYLTPPAPIPPVLARDDGHPLLYAGCLNGLFGEVGSGKSWAALLCIRHVLQHGGRAALLDYESTVAALGQRMRLLGGETILDTMQDPDRFLSYRGTKIREDVHQNSTLRTELANWLIEADINLLILDGQTTAGCPPDGGDVMPWYRQHLGPFIAKGITVITVDHVPKRRAGRPPGPVGSFWKLAIVDGVGLTVSGRCWTATQPGYVDLTIAKDRHGQAGAMGDRIATILGEWTDGSFGLTIGPPANHRGANTTSQKTERADKLLGWSRLEAGETVTVAQAADFLGVSKNTASTYLRDLTEEGWLTTEAGPRRATLYQLAEDGDVLDFPEPD